MRPLSVLFLLVAVASPAEAQEASEGSAPQDATSATPQTLPPEPAQEALLLVTVNVPGATLVVDDGPTVEAPSAASDVALGPHTVRVNAEGYETFEQSVQVPAEGARIDVFLEPSAALSARVAASEAANEDTYETSDSGVHKQWWFWAAVGGGVVVVASVIAAIALAGGDDGQSVIPVPPIPGGP